MRGNRNGKLLLFVLKSNRNIILGRNFLKTQKCVCKPLHSARADLGLVEKKKTLDSGKKNEILKVLCIRTEKKF